MRSGATPSLGAGRHGPTILKNLKDSKQLSAATADVRPGISAGFRSALEAAGSPIGPEVAARANVRHSHLHLALC